MSQRASLWLLKLKSVRHDGTDGGKKQNKKKTQTVSDSMWNMWIGSSQGAFKNSPSPDPIKKTTRQSLCGDNQRPAPWGARGNVTSSRVM